MAQFSVNPLERSRLCGGRYARGSGAVVAWRCRNPNFVLHRCSLLPHETPFSNPNPSRLTACSASLRLNPEQNSILNFLSTSSTILSCPSPFPFCRALPHNLRDTPHSCLLHSISIGPPQPQAGFVPSGLIERARSYMPASLLRQNARPIRC